MRILARQRRRTPHDIIQLTESLNLARSWSKSKVYLHPTAYAKNNVPGWLTIAQVSDSVNYLLSWLPEDLVEQGEDYENYVFVETAESDCAYPSQTRY